MVPPAPPAIFVAVVAVAALPPILKLATGVVEVTTRGAVPVAMVEVNCPVTLKLVPVAAPITGVTRVGEVANTATPVPVSSVKAVDKLAEVKEPKEAALPTLVTIPVRLASVVTVAALPPILKLATGVVEVITHGAVPVAMVEVICPLVLIEVGVIAPNPIVKAGVGEDIDHV